MQCAGIHLLAADYARSGLCGGTFIGLSVQSSRIKRNRLFCAYFAAVDVYYDNLSAVFFNREFSVFAKTLESSAVGQLFGSQKNVFCIFAETRRCGGNLPCLRSAQRNVKRAFHRLFQFINKIGRAWIPRMAINYIKSAFGRERNEKNVGIFALY